MSECDHDWKRVTEYGKEPSVKWCRICGALNTFYHSLCGVIYEEPEYLKERKR